ncbi:solute carrier family 13 member 5 [Lingula anatina]|uniref:Solute carrier family 13 member 5 n=1 Tax=Lingula anatina TaxID=7574 RepID=A0A1S3K766_LINAN|nr:solute carrier family 13 member 5 [Lingula anatina]|eukprot:XP_013418475.1 solute carrier family 13 member 5 [Lingula anatina]
MAGERARRCWAAKRFWVVILTPLLLLPLPILTGDDIGKTGYIALLMAIYWITEAVPMAMTALIPVALVPLLGIMTAKDISQQYWKDISMLQLAGFIMAVAIERCNLHKRMALKMLLIVGTEPKRLLFGLMLITWFLAMWMSTTGSTVAMMLPILEAILLRLEELETENEETPDNNSSEGETYRENPAYITSPDDDTGVVKADDGDLAHNKINDVEKSPGEKPKRRSTSSIRDMQKGFTLSIAYAASIGGTATLTGHSTNLIFKDVADQIYSDRKALTDPGITFASWLIYGFPVSLLVMLCTCFVLQLFFLGWRDTFCQGQAFRGKEEVNKVLRKEYERLGSMTFAEKAVLVHFVLLSLLWLTRDPRFIDGWSVGFKKGYVSDGTAAMAVIFSLFIIPSNPKKYFGFSPDTSTSDDDEDKDEDSPETLMDWNYAQRKVAWNILILIGGGVALAAACEASGLSDWVGAKLFTLSDLAPWQLIMVLCAVSTVMTEFVTNTATTTLFMPIVGGVAVQFGYNPVYIMWPVELCTNMTFMLPVGTSANAFVFAYGRIRIIDMVKVGFVLNIVSFAIVNLGASTWAYAAFKWSDFPFNSTSLVQSYGHYSTVFV